MAAPDTLPDRIELRELLLRRWSQADAAILFAAIQESFDHLSHWMSWPRQRRRPADVRSFVETAIAQWEAGDVFEYGIFDPSGGLLGSVEAHDHVGPGIWEIGYWVHVDHTGRGIATAVAANVTGVLMSLTGTERVEIHCDRSNRPSAAVAARLGYRLDRIEDGKRNARGRSGRQMIWTMTRDAYPGSAARSRARAALPR